MLETIWTAATCHFKLEYNYSDHYEYGLEESFSSEIEYSANDTQDLTG